MPWVKEEMCVGCGVCVQECPVEAISMPAQTAGIDDEECIRCGHCHEVCPEEAVRHDGERIPQQIAANLQWVRELLKHYEPPEQKQGLLERMKRHFAKEKKIAEQTIEKLGSLRIEG